MKMRILAFVAIFGLLASQLAQVPHSHAGMSAAEQQEHAATPHFHTREHGHPAKHGHWHGEHFHHHHATAEQPPEEGMGDHFDHEFTIYCSPDTDVVLISKTIPIPGDPLVFQIIEVAESCLPSTNNLSRHWHPPDPDWSTAHLYLSLRNLRI